MSNIWLIVAREFNERVRKKSFIVTTLLMPVLMLGLMLAPALMMRYASGQTKTIVVIDRSGLVAQRYVRWTVALTALCDILLFWDELFYYESFGLFAMLILVQLAATGAAAFRIYNKQRKG